jgi:hypothetical protein
MTRNPRRITEARRGSTRSRAGHPQTSRERRKIIMQVRHLVAAALLGLTTVAAMSQELDPTHDRVFSAQRTRESVKAEVGNLKAQGELKAVGETAVAPAVDAVPTASADRGLTRAEVKAELRQWRASHAVRVGELG